MADVACTVKSIGAAISLHCFDPNGWPWHDLLTVLGPLIGALIGAAAVAFAQQLSMRQQKELKKLEFDRIDAGVRRQLMALVLQASRYVAVAKNGGHINLVDYRHVLDQMNERIYSSDVPTALTDEQAGSLYAASETIEIAYRYALRQKDPNASKASFVSCYNKLECFWKAMGDSQKVEHFRRLGHDAALK